MSQQLPAAYLLVLYLELSRETIKLFYSPTDYVTRATNYKLCIYVCMYVDVYTRGDCSWPAMLGSALAKPTTNTLRRPKNRELIKLSLRVQRRYVPYLLTMYSAVSLLAPLPIRNFNPLLCFLSMRDLHTWPWVETCGERPQTGTAPRY